MFCIDVGNRDFKQFFDFQINPSCQRYIFPLCSIEINIIKYSHVIVIAIVELYIFKTFIHVSPIYGSVITKSVKFELSSVNCELSVYQSVNNGLFVCFERVYNFNPICLQFTSNLIQCDLISGRTLAIGRCRLCVG
ncbi:MAG: hypothetical protein A9Z00_12935 [Thermobacillus sp. ZCTH02-B1]|nr:MAG: hypothetical protein A9Z00_12935 [Thermobacillus sp. ZCTH02-B1]